MAYRYCSIIGEVLAPGPSSAAACSGDALPLGDEVNRLKRALTSVLGRECKTGIESRLDRLQYTDMIVVKSLTMAFGDGAAVDNVLFEVSRGEISALFGPNGAGKATRVNILITLLTASSGTIVIDGPDLAREQGGIRKRFGMVF